MKRYYTRTINTRNSNEKVSVFLTVKSAYDPQKTKGVW